MNYFKRLRQKYQDHIKRKQRKKFHIDSLNVENGIEGTYLRLCNEGSELYSPEELSGIDYLLCREVMFQPSVGSIYNLLSYTEKLCMEAAYGDGTLSPLSGHPYSDYIRLDKWLDNPDGENYSLVTAYGELSNAMMLLRDRTKKMSIPYVERRARRVLDSYILFCRILGELIDDEAKTKR